MTCQVTQKRCVFFPPILERGAQKSALRFSRWYLMKLTWSSGQDLDDISEWQRADRYVTRKLKIHNVSARYMERGASHESFRDRYRRADPVERAVGGTTRGAHSEIHRGRRASRREGRRIRVAVEINKPFASQSTQYLLSSSRSICVSRFWHFSWICLARSFSWRDVILAGSVFAKGLKGTGTTRDRDTPVSPPRDNAGQERGATVPRNGFRTAESPLAPAAGSRSRGRGGTTSVVTVDKISLSSVVIQRGNHTSSGLPTDSFTDNLFAQLLIPRRRESFWNWLRQSAEFFLSVFS